MITDILAGLFSGAFGAMGFGGGGILIVYLTLYKNLPQLTAQGTNLIFFIPCALIALIKHHKNNLIEWKISLRYIFSAILGLGAGYYLITVLGETLIRKIFSLLLIIIGLKDLFSKNKK